MLNADVCGTIFVVRFNRTGGCSSVKCPGSIRKIKFFEAITCSVSTKGKIV